MDTDRIDGVVNQAVGAVKSAVGDLVGDAKLKADGDAQKAAGKIQNALGSVKDTVRDASA